MRLIGIAMAAWTMAVVAQPVAAADLQVASPDGKIVVRFAPETLRYRIDYQDRPVIAASRLGLELDGQPALQDGFRVVSATPDSHDETWTPVCGERSKVRNHYRELTVDLEETTALRRRLQMVFRVYDAGAAFCYVIPKQEKLAELNIKAETTEFRFHGQPSRPCHLLGPRDVRSSDVGQGEAQLRASAGGRNGRGAVRCGRRRPG